MGAEVVANCFHTFKPWGVSGTVTIAESHLAVHTWPEYNFAAVTFETCGQGMDHKRLTDTWSNSSNRSIPRSPFRKEALWMLLRESWPISKRLVD
jgi:hypothetical protein